MPKVSVVIPVYNSAEFLDQCIDSLLAQAQRDCEFIFVNDGSTDNGGDIILSYRQKDNRIKIITQENQGVSLARNNGMAKATGEFLSFVDADDTIAPDMFETLCNLAAEYHSDVVCSGFIYEQDGRTCRLDMPFPKNLPYTQESISREVIPYMLRYDLLNSVANKMYRRSLVATNHIVFPAGQALGEDAIFNFKAIGKAHQIVFTNYAGYFYREVAGSATRNIGNKDYFATLLKAYEFDHTPLLPLGFDKKQMQHLKEMRLVEQAISYLSLYAKPNPEVPAAKRLKYVSDMISHPVMQELVRKHWQTLIQGQGRFKKFVLSCVKRRQPRLVWLAQAYSNFRNKK